MAIRGMTRGEGLRAALDQPSALSAEMSTAQIIVVATPNWWANQVVTGAAAMAAMPAMAEFSPINVEEMPRFSRMMLSRGRPRPMAMPTAVMAETAATRDGQ